MKFSALMTGQYFGFKPGQRAVLCLSPDSIGGKMLMVRAILHNMELIVTDLQRNPLEQVDFEVDFVSMVPMQIQTVIQESPEKLNLVKNLLIGGAAVSPKLEDLLKPFLVNAFESFGMTETMSHIAVRKLNQGKNTPFEALEGIHLSLRDEKLVIHAEKLGLPSLETNDTVELIDDKHFVWKGRADFAINSGGIKFHPEVIEKKLSPAMENRFFIAGAKDDTLGEKIIIVIEGDAKVVSAGFIQDVCAERLGKYEVPKNIYFVDKFAETVSGKVSRIETLKKLGF